MIPPVHPVLPFLPLQQKVILEKITLEPSLKPNFTSENYREVVVEDNDLGKVRPIKVEFLQPQSLLQPSQHSQSTKFLKPLPNPNKCNIKHEPNLDQVTNSVNLTITEEPPGIYNGPIITIELLDQYLQVTSRIIVILSDVKVHTDYIQISWRFTV